MPNLDGLSMVEKVRGELGNAAVHIVMLTTENSPTMKERGNAAGVKAGLASHSMAMRCWLRFASQLACEQSASGEPLVQRPGG
jgi:CheY-like chemotaxis protein